MDIEWTWTCTSYGDHLFTHLLLLLNSYANNNDLLNLTGWLRTSEARWLWQVFACRLRHLADPSITYHRPSTRVISVPNKLITILRLVNTPLRLLDPELLMRSCADHVVSVHS